MVDLSALLSENLLLHENFLYLTKLIIFIRTKRLKSPQEKKERRMNGKDHETYL